MRSWSCAAFFGAALGFAGAASGQADMPEAVAEREAGPALREAIAALASEEPARAREQLARVGRRYPIIADHAQQQIIASYAREQEHASVAEFAREFAAAMPESPLVGRVAALEAEAAVALGDEPLARAAFEVARREASGRDERAAHALAIARSHERSGALEDAARAVLGVWRDDAATPSASEAEPALARLESALARPLVRASDRDERCRALFAAYWNDAALTACDAALADSSLAPARREALAALRAELLFRDRRYREAEAAFAALGSAREHRFWHARALARSGRIDEAKAALEKLGEQPDDWGARALFLAGTLYEDDDVATASERYRAALAQAGRPELRIEARWRLAWRAYLERRFGEAASGLAALASDTADPIEALRARYWEARALASSGDPRGPAKFASLARDWGFTYYGQQSQRHAQGAEPDAPAAPAAQVPAGSGSAALDPLRLARVRVLLEAGLVEDAGSEARGLAARAKRREDRLALAALLQDAGQFDAAQRVILDAYSLALAAGPAGGEPDLWWAAYPQAFAPEVERAAARHGIPPQLLYAVMREESGFRPRALSVVGARGLVQLMPETGRNLATRLGAANFAVDELFVPARNLELGAAYLAELLARFDGRVSAAVASYNAGPDAVARWLARDAALDEDEWIESIPYDQTRAYAKRVLRSFAIYQGLY